MGLLIAAAEKHILPDGMIRMGIRSLLRSRLKNESRHASNQGPDQMADLIRVMDRSPIAPVPEMANQEHYTLPPDFFRLFLGRWRKYSCGLWNDATRDLDAAEEAMLELTCRRAGVKDGMQVLDLGCGWGSLSLWLASHYPRCQILSVSNSPTQRQFIQEECGRRGMANVQVITADMNEFQPDARFDRVISLEMFEHMRNYRLLLRRIRSWLQPDGKLFVHIFRHKSLGYFFEPQGESDWMARYFFTGGMMPSASLLGAFDADMFVVQAWQVNGLHYHKTLDTWLTNLDGNRQAAHEILTGVYPAGETELWLQRWRIFMMACSELFRFNDGQEWDVGHYLLKPSAPV